MSILDQIGCKALVYKNSLGKIIARVLIYDGQYYGRVYAHSSVLSEKFSEYLAGNYEKLPDDWESSEIMGKPEDYFIPWMDYAEYLQKTPRGFRFSTERDGAFALCSEIRGGVTWLA